MKEKNGITLIALIITIIIMLILVAVTIMMAVNGGLFGYAGNAAKDTELAKNAELGLSNGGVTIDEITYASMDAYKASLNCEHNWGEEQIIKEATCTEEGERAVTCLLCGAQKRETIKKANHTYANNSSGWVIIPEEGKEANTCTVCNQLIKRYIVGATINGYDPTNGGTINTTYTSLGSLDTNTTGEYGDGTTGNGNTNTRITLFNSNIMQWKILGEEDGQIIITPTTTNNSTVPFKGKSGYAHFIDELNNYCSIYGQGTYADTTKFSLARNVEDSGGTLIRQEIVPNASGARSIKLEDLERIGYTVKKNSYTFRKDATTNKIFNSSISNSNSRYDVFAYWNECIDNPTKPYTFVELNPGESVKINRINLISGQTTQLALNMLKNYCKYNQSSYTTFYFADRSCGLAYNSDDEPIQGKLDYGAVTGSRSNYDGFSIGLDYSMATSINSVNGYGMGRLYRPVVYLRSDVTVSYDSQTGEYTINS